MRILLSAVFIATATPSFANELARLEAATEASARNWSAFLVRRAPELGLTIPSVEWDSRFRNSGRCFLNEIERASGPSGVATLLSALESWSTTKITSMSQLAQMPHPLINADAQAAAKTCKTVELATFRMYQSGMLQMIQDPAVIEKLKD